MTPDLWANFHDSSGSGGSPVGGQTQLHRERQSAQRDDHAEGVHRNPANDAGSDESADQEIRLPMAGHRAQCTGAQIVNAIVATAFANPESAFFRALSRSSVPSIIEPSVASSKIPPAAQL